MGKKVEEPREHIVSARLTTTERNALKRIAKKRRLPLSDIVRERLLGTRLVGEFYEE